MRELNLGRSLPGMPALSTCISLIAEAAPDKAEPDPTKPLFTEFLLLCSIIKQIAW
jgi:hypothetical protein